MTIAYDEWFERLTGDRPHDWQIALAAEARPRDRLIRIPTGFGKTAGVVLAWAFHRTVRRDDAWPRRLVFCLPMRVLVEQTERNVRGWLERAGLADRVGVSVLMGGLEADEWALDPEGDRVLIGTQDMLLSRALNRGYGAARGRWPMEFGLLHQDSLWVLDEVQLMGVGLATATQLAAFRAQETRRCLRPAATWWMSATLQPSWLATVDHQEAARALGTDVLAIPSARRTGGLWRNRKALEIADGAAAPSELAALVYERHVGGRMTLVVVNRVDRAVQVFEAIERAFDKKSSRQRPDLRLVHSRFRGAERQSWDFLRRDAEPPKEGRVIVATQVVEAGVDLSARFLITDLAPWSSLVQRFGRAARYPGEEGEVVVVGGVPKDDRSAQPYALGELAAASDALARLAGRERDVAPRALESFEDDLRSGDPELLARLYPFDPQHVLRRQELDELFDTTPDLTGTDLDVARFIREGEERDAAVFWRPVEGSPRELSRRDVPSPRRDEQVRVPLYALREWGKKRKVEGYVFDYLDGCWRRVSLGDVARVHAGSTVLLATAVGGYDPARGFRPESDAPVTPVAFDAHEDELSRTSEAEDADDLSRARAWKTIATHGREVREVVIAITNALGLDSRLRDVLELAARWHDVGKAHATFQGAIREDAREAAGGLAMRCDLAKAPDDAWRRGNPYGSDRRGFRHELASTLALLELLRRAAPEHPGLLGPHVDTFAAVGTPLELPTKAEQVDASNPLVREIVGLDASDLDLLLWLVCTHHGKVRCSWTTTPHDQEAGLGAIHGVCSGDPIRDCELAVAGGATAPIPALQLSLDAAALGLGARYGASWSDRVRGLLARSGPFTLAFLEALVRAADVRASRLDTEDPLR